MHACTFVLSTDPGTGTEHYCVAEAVDGAVYCPVHCRFMGHVRFQAPPEPVRVSAAANPDIDVLPWSADDRHIFAQYAAFTARGRRRP